VKVLLPNCFLCFITYVIAREKQRKHLGSGAIADGETDAKNASVDGPLRNSSRKLKMPKEYRFVGSKLS
jgi:hypothetical protein